MPLGILLPLTLDIRFKFAIGILGETLYKSSLKEGDYIDFKL